MGRYIIENPEPPGAIDQLRGNINRLGNFYFQNKMAELERRRKREDELELLREKAKIERESSPFSGILEGGKASEALGNLSEGASPEQRIVLKDLASRISQKALGRLAPIGTAAVQPDIQLSQTPNLPMSPTITLSPMGQPVFEGSEIPESTTYKRTKFGDLEPETVKTISPQAEEYKFGMKRIENLGEIPPDKAGLVTLADTSIANVDKAINALFPKGGASSFKRGVAFGSNMPSPNMPFVGPILPKMTLIGRTTAMQDTFRWITTALTGRKLIETGVAARPDETETLRQAFAPSITSDPQSALNGLNELKQFYVDFKYNISTKGIDELRVMYPGFDKFMESQGIDTGKLNPVFGNQQSQRINVISPDGQEGDIPYEQLEEALRSGYRRR